MKTWADFRIDIPSGASGEIRTTCPECSHTRKKKNVKCLAVNITDEVWNCHHCAWTGTLKSGGRKSDLHWQKPRYRKPEPPKQTDNSAKMIQWFTSRGLDDSDILARNRIQSARVYMPQLEDYTTAIAFPYYRGDELVNCKYRDGRKNFRMEPGAERILYGLNDLAETTVIVEGEMDKLSLEAVGIKHCVSVPDGAPPLNSKNYASKFSYLEAEELTLVEKWIIAVDNDEPGQRLEAELARRFGRERCYRVTWPEGCKDANDVLLNFGGAVLKGCIDRAEPWPVEGLIEPKDTLEAVKALYKNGWECGLSTGWQTVDEFYTVRAGELTVMTGIPNAGKSNWLDCLMINLAVNHGWTFGVFSPENQPVEDHQARMIEKWLRVPFHNGRNTRMSETDLADGMQWLQEHFTWILPELDTEWTVDVILDRAKSSVLRKGISGLVIDPWNELESMRPAQMTETEYISGALKRIRQFARHYSVHIWVVGHPAKLYKDKTGTYPVPTPYDISGSAHWRNKADNCITVWRDFSSDITDVTEIHVQKIRFRQIGKVGTAHLKFRRLTQTYLDTIEYPYEVVHGGE